MSDERAKEVRIEAVDNGYVVQAKNTTDNRHADSIGTKTVHETFESLVAELAFRFQEVTGEGPPRCEAVLEGRICSLNAGHVEDHMTPMNDIDPVNPPMFRFTDDDMVAS